MHTNIEEESIAEVDQPFLSTTGKFSMMYFNKTDTCIWTGIVFTSPFHDICCLSFQLEFGGMNLVADNFKYFQRLLGILT